MEFQVFYSQPNVNNCPKGCPRTTLSLPDAFFPATEEPHNRARRRLPGSRGRGRAGRRRPGGATPSPRNRNGEAAGGPGPGSASPRCRAERGRPSPLSPRDLGAPSQHRGERSDRERRPASGTGRRSGGGTEADPARRGARPAALLAGGERRGRPQKPLRDPAARQRAGRGRPAPSRPGWAGPGARAYSFPGGAAAAGSLSQRPRRPRTPHSPGGCWCSPWAPPGRPARPALQSPFKSPAHGRPARANGALASSVRDVTHNNAPPAVGGTSVQPANFTGLATCHSRSSPHGAPPISLSARSVRACAAVAGMLPASLPVGVRAVGRAAFPTSALRSHPGFLPDVKAPWERRGDVRRPGGSYATPWRHGARCRLLSR